MTELRFSFGCFASQSIAIKRLADDLKPSLLGMTTPELESLARIMIKTSRGEIDAGAAIIWSHAEAANGVGLGDLLYSIN